MTLSEGDELRSIENRIQREINQINVGKKEVEFNYNDEIFKLREPVGTKVISENCNSCDANISKEKEQYCDYCGSRNCKKCMYKTRQFQSHLMDAETENIVQPIATGSKLSNSIANVTPRLSKNNSTESSLIPSGKCGKVCKICDRKFFMYSHYHKYIT